MDVFFERSPRGMRLVHASASAFFAATASPPIPSQLHRRIQRNLPPNAGRNREKRIRRIRFNGAWQTENRIRPRAGAECAVAVVDVAGIVVRVVRIVREQVLHFETERDALRDDLRDVQVDVERRVREQAVYDCAAAAAGRADDARLAGCSWRLRIDVVTVLAGTGAIQIGVWYEDGLAVDEDRLVGPDADGIAADVAEDRVDLPAAVIVVKRDRCVERREVWRMEGCAACEQRGLDRRAERVARDVVYELVRVRQVELRGQALRDLP